MGTFTIKLKSLLAVLVCFFLVGCQKENVDDYEKPLLVMVSPDNPPFEFKDTGTGGNGVLGFDIDLINKVGEQLGRKIQIVEVDFSAIIPGIQSKRADMAISGFAATERRRQSVDFSDSYHSYNFAVVTNQGTTVNSHKDLANMTIGTQLGSTHETKAQELASSLSGVTVYSLNKLPELILDLKKGRADAVMTEEVVAQKIVATTPGLQFTVLDDIGSESYFIVFPKGSPLIGEVNKALENLKSSGQIDQLVRKWLEGGYIEDFDFSWADVTYILGGIPITLGFTIASIICGFVWGGILALFKVGEIKPLNWFAAGYTSVFRGTPLLLQLWIVWFALPVELTLWQAGILTFSLNSGAYISEIMRAGIQAVDTGQMEAAKSLGVSYIRAMYDIILPQAFRKMLPSLTNESITLLKESALISVIGAPDILKRATSVGVANFGYFEPLLTAGALYYMMVMIVASGAKLLERKLRLP